MDSSLVDSRQLPAAILWSATGVLAIIIVMVIARANSRAERFSIFAVWVRYIMSAHHGITFKPLVAGLSVNAVGSIAIVGIGILTVNARNLLNKFFIPPAIVVLTMALSGLANGDIGSVVGSATKLGYFAIVTIAVYEALGKSNEKAVMSRLLWAFTPLLLFQLLSIATGTVKAGESDGSTSYIGGYNHEAAFSVGLAACVLTACFTALSRRVIANLVVLASLVGIYLANYRTTIIAVTPLLFVNYALPQLRPVVASQRNLIRYAAIVVVAIFIIGLAVEFQDRFSDLVAVLTDPRPTIRDPQTFSFEERRYLSGRPYLWSQYYWAWKEGGGLQHLLGFGPNASESAFPIHPHNTLVQTLYDMGVLGVAAMLAWWSSMAAFALGADPSRRVVLLAGHLSFFLINMATSPLWMIEGNIFYGLLCGLTLYHWQLARRARLRARAASLDGAEASRDIDHQPQEPAGVLGSRRHRPARPMP